MSTVKVDTIKTTGNVEVYTCKAWVNFNGTGTVAIRGSGNVSSITDNGTGQYTINFATAMPDVNYTTLITNENGSSAVVRYTTTYGSTISTGSYSFATREGTSGTSQNGALQDQQYIRVAVFR